MQIFNATLMGGKDFTTRVGGGPFPRNCGNAKRLWILLKTIKIFLRPAPPGVNFASNLDKINAQKGQRSGNVADTSRFWAMSAVLPPAAGAVWFYDIPWLRYASRNQRTKLVWPNQI